MKYLPVLLMAVFPCLSHAGTVSEDRDFIERMQSAEGKRHIQTVLTLKPM